MRFKLKNIKPGYAEIWMNRRVGARYKRVATILRDECTSGKGQAWHVSTKEFATTHETDTRSECVRYFERRMLIRQANDAIAEDGGFSKTFWHCACRDALVDMRESGVFSYQELEDAESMMKEGKPVAFLLVRPTTT